MVIEALVIMLVAGLIFIGLYEIMKKWIDDGIKEYELEKKRKRLIIIKGGKNYEEHSKRARI